MKGRFRAVWLCFEIETFKKGMSSLLSGRDLNECVPVSPITLSSSNVSSVLRLEAASTVMAKYLPNMQTK